MFGEKALLLSAPAPQRLQNKSPSEVMAAPQAIFFDLCREQRKKIKDIAFLRLFFYEAGAIFIKVTVIYRIFNTMRVL